MSYNRHQIKLLIQVFTAAKKVIAEPESSEFLCHALCTLNLRGWIGTYTARELVREALDYRSTLEAWQRDMGTKSLAQSARKRLRIQWCDKIIRDLRSYQ